MSVLDMLKDAEALAFNRRLTEKHQAESTARQTEESRLHRAAIQSRQSAWDKEEKARIDARLASDRAAGIDIYKQRQAQHEARQKVEWQWGLRRKELENDVAGLKGQLRGAQATLVSGALDDGRVAAADVQVYEARIKAAEAALSAHVQAQPRFYA